VAASDKRNGDSSNRCCSCRLLDLTSALARCDLVMSLHQMTPNEKADQRRTTGSATPLDPIRRLIQRLVLATSSLRPRRLGVVVGAGRLFCRQQHLAAVLL
jgi:hypothetical protein